MAAVTGITSIKRFTYRLNANEEWSNTYHFKGPPPGDDASWLVLGNDLVTHERPILPFGCFIVAMYGYNSDDPKAHHVWAHDFSSPGPPPEGTMVPGSSQMFAGDQAAVVQWKLNRLNTRGKPVFLRKYYHGGAIKAGEPDNLDPVYYGALGTFAGAGGLQSMHGGLRSQRLDDAVVGTGAPLTYVTTRTLKRRGKRPRTAS